MRMFVTLRARTWFGGFIVQEYSCPRDLRAGIYRVMRDPSVDALSLSGGSVIIPKASILFVEFDDAS